LELGSDGVDVFERDLRRHGKRDGGTRTSSKVAVLLALLDKVDTPQGLSHVLRFPASTVSHMLSELERKGFITRTLDASDKRRFRLERTPAGQQALDAGIAAINGAVAARMEG
jgi:DNA-binding MarR family transcriptional regulator